MSEAATVGRRFAFFLDLPLKHDRPNDSIGRCNNGSRTSNVEAFKRQPLDVECWMLDVGCSLALMQNLHATPENRMRLCIENHRIKVERLLWGE